MLEIVRHADDIRQAEDLDVVFTTFKQDAERLVRHVKDLAVEDAVVLLLEALLDVRRTAQEAVLTEVTTQLSRALREES